LKVLGITGFENSIPYLKSLYPGRDEREYRISQGHDSAAALLIDGEIIAACEEERFSRNKHTGAFPSGAIQYCLDEAKLDLADLDAIAHAFDYEPVKKLWLGKPETARLYHEVFSPERLRSHLERDFPNADSSKLRHVSHHESHEASAYYCSGFDECLSLVIDGMGEMHGASVYHRTGAGATRLGRISAANSIGILYSLVTLHLGFDFNADEYKIMGLAPYGDADRYRSFFDEQVRLTASGGLQIPLLRLNKTPEERDFYLASRAFLGENLIPPREPEASLTDDHRDVAASLQACLDRVLVGIACFYAEKTGCRKLAMAGGVALNCTSNGKLLKAGCFDEVFVQPIAGDDGTALGAALLVEAEAGALESTRIGVPFFGPAPAADEIRSAVEAVRDQVEVENLGSLEAAAQRAAQEIGAGNVVAWYRGRMEFGPRALGHRSILADPQHPAMRERVNAMVKMREAFRPFAPAILESEAARYFEIPEGSSYPYMIVIVDVREEHRARFPATTHIDGTARLQTVSAENNPIFHTLLTEVGKVTGIPMVLNTSFNVKGQPIVHTCQEAIATYLMTGIDTLILDDYCLRKRSA
jgi:carbamoyltransferase